MNLSAILGADVYYSSVLLSTTEAKCVPGGPAIYLLDDPTGAYFPISSLERASFVELTLHLFDFFVGNRSLVGADIMHLRINSSCSVSLDVLFLLFHARNFGQN